MSPWVGFGFHEELEIADILSVGMQYLSHSLRWRFMQPLVVHGFCVLAVADEYPNSSVRMRVLLWAQKVVEEPVVTVTLRADLFSGSHLDTVLRTPINSNDFDL